MKKPQPISGFPEWLPEQRIAEQLIIDRIRQAFELFGFSPIETRAVEPLDQLLMKGETDKEIYVLKRLHAAEADKDASLGLHFDLTVPFARYVAQHKDKLVFPFRRYQIQKVWRGERPQEGRYREFYQADIDIVGDGALSLEADIEIADVIYQVLSSLPIPKVRIQLNNRRVLEGFFRGLGATDIAPTLRAVDKLLKIGPDGVKKILVGELGFSSEAAEKILELVRIEGSGREVADRIRALGVEHELLTQGLEELRALSAGLAHLPEGAVVVAMHIARGLDYYTGTVYEVVMEGLEHVGSICSGGRYDNLVDAKAKLPGVGVSIGVTRLLGVLFGHERITTSRATPTCVLVALPSDEARAAARSIARNLRERGIATEVFHAPQKYSKQIRYAERKGIPFVWFPEAEGSGEHEVKDIRSGEQAKADPRDWMPPEDDRHVDVRAAVAQD